MNIRGFSPTSDVALCAHPRACQSSGAAAPPSRKRRRESSGAEQLRLFDMESPSRALCDSSESAARVTAEGEFAEPRRPPRFASPSKAVAKRGTLQLFVVRLALTGHDLAHAEKATEPQHVRPLPWLPELAAPRRADARRTAAILDPIQGQRMVTLRDPS
jgi:hypothetical protein